MSRRKRASKIREPRRVKKARKLLLGPRLSSPWQDELDRMKQAEREADARAIAEGRATLEELERRNGLFNGKGAVLDYEAACKLW